jgi:hypothetical protein
MRPKLQKNDIPPPFPFLFLLFLSVLLVRNEASATKGRSQGEILSTHSLPPFPPLFLLLQLLLFLFYFLCLFSIIFSLFFLRSLLLFILPFPLPPHSLYPSYLPLFSLPVTIPPFSFSNVHSLYSLSFFSLSLWLYSPFDLARFFFNFLILYTVGRTPWTGDRPVARPLHIHRTTQTQNKRIHRHPSLEWDSNPRSQCSSGRRRFMP